ncbi:MAG TPA: PAS domain-containing sensor histidine kinase [Ohtaekwangia sp.]|nr:PAS domain-containing sensor histidine kinase [Ohtaekwangia sp.]
MEGKKYSFTVLKDIGKLSSDGILIYDLKSDAVAYCNKTLAVILGMSRKKILESSYDVLRSRLKDDDEFLQNTLGALKARCKITNVELRVKAKKEKYIAVDAYWLKKAGVIVSLIKDVTNAKEHTNYLSEFGARKDTILDMVAHNLSGPLNMTTNLLNIVDQQTHGMHFKRIENHTRLIRENTQQCIEVINSFLREEHLASKDTFVETNRYDAIAKIRIIIEHFKEFTHDKALKLVSEANDLFVSGDDVKFFQIVHNLISNAVKFTPSKGTITVTVTERESAFSVSVNDTGIGIPEHLQPYIFKKSTPAARDGLRGEKSIGMGLYVVKKLVELMKGRLLFQSTENKGSTFTFELPKN